MSNIYQNTVDAIDTASTGSTESQESQESHRALMPHGSQTSLAREPYGPAGMSTVPQLDSTTSDDTAI
jgi:hypothetical protein